ncbi:MAG: hypothetical protein AB1758_23490 [Candidatus Eremiobacterota bacterium]
MNQALDQVGRLYRAMAQLRAQVGEGNERQFRLLAEGTWDHIRRIQGDLDEQVGAAMILGPDLWLRVESPVISDGASPVSILTALLDALRKGLQSIVEFDERRARRTRPRKSTLQMCDFELVAMASGSLKVGLRLPEDPQLSLMDADSPACRALRDFVQVAAWASAEAEPSGDIHDPHRQRLLLSAVKSLTPRPRGTVTFVELSGRLIPPGMRVHLTRDSQRRIDEALDRMVTERLETHVGRLRELDLDHRSFILRRLKDTETDQIQCLFDEEFTATALQAFDKEVEVSGVRPNAGQPASRLKVTRIVVMDNPDEE